MIKDELLGEIRTVKKHCSSEKFDYEDGYGEMCHLVWTALDIADELREAILVAKENNEKIVYGKDIPGYYKVVIEKQLKRIGDEIK